MISLGFTETSKSYDPQPRLSMSSVVLYHMQITYKGGEDR